MRGKQHSFSLSSHAFEWAVPQLGFISMKTNSSFWANLLFVLALPLSGLAQEEGGKSFPPVPDELIPRYDVYRTKKSMVIDGKLDEAVWSNTRPSRKFVDLITGEKTQYSTTVKVLWDLEYLYLGYEIQEPNVQAKFTQRDSPIWQENDVEFFIAGRDAYYELEINARGTLYEGLFVWQDVYETAGFSTIPELDVRREEVRRQKFNGVGLRNHPRGLRWAFLAWDLPNLKSAVSVQGTLNDPSDTDQGWSVELAIPWSALKILDRSIPRKWPPRDGDVWRVDVSRFNQQKAEGEPVDSGGWAWSHHGIWDSHIPECFTYLILKDEIVGEAKP